MLSNHLRRLQRLEADLERRESEDDNDESKDPYHVLQVTRFYRLFVKSCDGGDEHPELVQHLRDELELLELILASSQPMPHANYQCNVKWTVYLWRVIDAANKNDEALLTQYLLELPKHSVRSAIETDQRNFNHQVKA